MRSPAFHFVLALIISLAVIVGYATWYANVSKKSSDVANLQNQIAVASDDMSRISSARDALSDIADDEDAIQNYFVSDVNVVSFINELEMLGFAESATVGVISVSKSGTRTFPTLLLTLSIDGTFDAVMRTVGAIEYAPYAISVSTLGVVRGEGNIWHANLNIIVDSVPSVTASSTSHL